MVELGQMLLTQLFKFLGKCLESDLKNTIFAVQICFLIIINQLIITT